jgi:hypothetical protein
MIYEMENLQYMKFNLNFDKSYNRTISTGESTILQFSFKVLTATIRLSDIYTQDELIKVNEVLEYLGVFLPDTPYVRLSAKDLGEIIDAFLETIGKSDVFDESYAMIADIIDILEPKLEPENSLILLITDY